MDAMPTAEPGHGAPTGLAALDLSQRTKLEILGAILLGLFLGALDQTIVGTALPRIVTDLGGNELYTWVVTIYLLASTITVPFYGKLSDIYGRKPLLMLGVTLFLAGSALSGLSQDIYQLILFRGVQGLGAGALFPISLAVIGDLFTPAERGKYQGLFGAVFGISSLIGPALGGFLTDVISWHWIFYVNLPIGIVALYVIWRLLPNVRHPELRHRLDFLGAAVFTVGIAALLVGLTNKQTGDWSEPQVGGLIAAGLAISAVFLLIESRAKEPIVPLDLWRIRTYATSIVATFFVSFGFFGAVIFLPRWFQVVKGVSATESGYQALALLAGLIVSSIVAGQIVARTGRYKAVLLGGLSLMALGLLLMSNLRADTDLPVLWLWMAITGMGIGPTLSVFTIVVQNAVPMNKLGVATSNLTFFRQIGGSVGLAIVGTAFATSLADELPRQAGPVFGQIAAAAPPQLAGQLAQVGAQLAGGSVNVQDFTGVGQSFGQAVSGFVGQATGDPAAVQALFAPFVPQLDGAFHAAFSLAVASTFLIGAFTTVVAIASTALMAEIPLRQTLGTQPGPAAGRPSGPPQSGVPGTPAPVPVEVEAAVTAGRPAGPPGRPGAGPTARLGAPAGATDRAAAAEPVAAGGRPAID